MWNVGFHLLGICHWTRIEKIRLGFWTLLKITANKLGAAIELTDFPQQVLIVLWRQLEVSSSVSIDISMTGRLIGSNSWNCLLRQRAMYDLQCMIAPYGRFWVVPKCWSMVSTRSDMGLQWSRTSSGWPHMFSVGPNQFVAYGQPIGMNHKLATKQLKILHTQYIKQMLSVYMRRSG